LTDAQRERPFCAGGAPLITADAQRERPFCAGGAPLITADEMRAWDRHAIDERGIPGRVLMEAAGRAAAEVVERLYPEGRVVAAVGGGNNGGDALVCLRTLAARGREVAAVQAGSAFPDRALLHGWELESHPAERAEAAFRGAAVVLDGILGTGAEGAPRAPAAAVIEAIAASGRPVVALDGPSGVDMTTGEAPGAAVRADVTVTFGAPKRGLLLFPGRRFAGRVVAVEIGFPPLAPERAGARVVTGAWVRARLPVVPPDAHKGTLGTVVAVAGRSGVAGAAVMAAMGALRAGAGMARVVSHADNRLVIQQAVPEALFTDRASAELDAALERADAVVAGPGMGTGDAELELLRRIARRGDAPLLLDADAVTLLAREPEFRAEVRGPLLLTPHPGEASRLLGRPVREITADPFAAAAEIAARFECAAILKGTPSLVVAPGEPALVSVAGHSGIATGGMGDTLSGVAGALLGMGCSPRDAAAIGLFLSGRAAEIAGRGRSLLPRDVDAALPDAYASLETVERSDLPGVVFDLRAAY
ncbi:MAG TPA: NAD(P)H-hydrate dehydratase, partial [Longimicrobium sp.]|nr:NAD(P)H-hydrate dehydratase [Longimicrobium sp.]